MIAAAVTSAGVAAVASDGRTKDEIRMRNDDFMCEINDEHEIGC